MISTNQLVKRHGSLEVLRGISLHVRAGEVAVIIGPSGGGKSTFLRCLNGLESFQSGEIRVQDITLKPGEPDASQRQSLQQIRQRVGMVFQQFNLFPHLTVVENVALAPIHVLKAPPDIAREQAKRILDRVGLSDKIDERPHRLSGGQQQRVAIARALAVQPDAILFDEPTSALDPRMTAEVLAVLSDLAKSGQTMIVTTHAMTFARRAAHTVHVFYGGQVLESGSPDQIFEHPAQPQTAEFLHESSAT